MHHMGHHIDTRYGYTISIYSMEIVWSVWTGSCPKSAGSPVPEGRKQASTGLLFANCLLNIPADRKNVREKPFSLTLSCFFYTHNGHTIYCIFVLHFDLNVGILVVHVKKQAGFRPSGPSSDPMKKPGGAVRCQRQDAVLTETDDSIYSKISTGCTEKRESKENEYHQDQEARRAHRGI